MLINEPRYSVSRRMLNWYKTDELMCLKMLAYVIRCNEAAGRSKIELWRRVEVLYPEILRAVLGKSQTFVEVRAATELDQGIKITPNKLLQRADKAARYGEFNIHLKCVEAAYRAITGKPMPSKGPRDFTNAQVKQALDFQGGKCYYRGCDCTEGVEGEHIVAWSRGGPTETWNCAAACVRCNREKGVMTVLEYGKLIGAQNARGRQL